MIANSLVLFCIVFGLMLSPAKANAQAAVGISYVAEKNGVRLLLNGVTHGPSMDAPSATTSDSFAAASMVITEFDMTNPSRASRAAEDLRDGKSLAMNKFLNEAELETVRLAWSKKLKRPASMTARVLGELNACSFSMLLLPSGAHSPPNSPKSTPGVSWEEKFLAQAKRSGKTIAELEPNGIRSACEKLTTAEVHALVLDAAKNWLDDGAFDISTQHTLLMNSSIRRQDTKAGYEHMLDSISFSGSYKTAFLRLLNLRNEAFVSTLEQRHSELDKGSIFVMFGALHLHGPNGVLALLEAKGFRITKPASN